MILLSPSAEMILKQLSIYHFLTVSQMFTLKITKNKISLYRLLKNLTDGKKPLVKALKYGVHAKLGKIENLYYLTTYGARILVDDFGIEEYKIKVPKNSIAIGSDYFHRITCIDFYISLNIFLKQKLNSYISFYDYYFDKSKNKAKNRLDLDFKTFIIPDVVVKFWSNDNERLYLVEVHNGNSIAKITTQIYQHTKIILEQIAKNKYKTINNNRVCLIFEYKEIMLSALKRLTEDNSMDKFNNFFISSTKEDIKNNNFDNWINLKGDVVDFC